MSLADLRLAALEARTAQLVPGFQVRFKGESRTQRAIARIAFWAPYMEMVTVFGATVWWPSREAYIRDTKATFSVLAHELVHLIDAQRHPVWFWASYALPQVGAITALLAIVSLWAPVTIWAILAMLLLAPWPSPWRLQWELRGYAMEMAIEAWESGEALLSLERAMLMLHGWGYYKAAWRQKRVDGLVMSAEAVVHNGDILGWSPAFPEVRAIVGMSEQELQRVSNV